MRFQFLLSQIGRRMVSISHKEISSKSFYAILEMHMPISWIALPDVLFIFVSVLNSLSEKSFERFPKRDVSSLLCHRVHSSVSAFFNWIYPVSYLPLHLQCGNARFRK